MDIYKIIELEQGSKAWLDFRRSRIGASEIPSILCLPDAYQSRASLLNEKITGVQVEHTEWTKNAMNLGHELELVIRHQYNATTGADYKPCVVQSIANPNFIASLDGLWEGSILEVKSTSSKKTLDGIMEGDIPLRWQAQMAWQAMIIGADHVMLAVVNSKTGLPIITKFPVDLTSYNTMMREAARFLAEMSTGVTPYQVVDTAEMLEILEWKQLIKEAQKKIDAYEAEIKKTAERILTVACAEKIEGNGVKIEWQERVGSVQYNLIPELKGVDLDKYRKQSSRFIKITDINKDKQLIEKEVKYVQ